MCAPDVASLVGYAAVERCRCGLAIWKLQCVSVVWTPVLLRGCCRQLQSVYTPGDSLEERVTDLFSYASAMGLEDRLAAGATVVRM